MLCRILHDIYDILAANVVLSRSSKNLAYFDVKGHFVYIMKIYEYERTFLVKKYAHNVTQYEVRIRIVS